MSQYASYPSLKDRVVFVTGGASGIGESIVEHFCGQGADVTFVDIADEAAAALIARIGEAGHRPPRYIPCDVRNVPALQSAIRDTGEARGAIGTLVNNVANDARHSIEEVTVEYWDDRMALNLRPCFFATQAVIEQMKPAGGGTIVNIGSFTGYRLEGGFPGYSAAKAGIWGLTRAFARDLGKHNIRVNLAMPGWTMTQRQIDLWLTPEGEAEIAMKQCLPDKVYPADVARMALFLAADDSRMCSAQEFIVDGGWV